MSYNGWKNYETWLVNLWLTNDEVSTQELNRIATEPEEINEAAENLKQYVEDSVYHITSEPSMVSDLIQAALSEVDWYDIVKQPRVEAGMLEAV